jgi:hypothetical protein
MATQRYISTSFWDDPWIRKLTPDERYLYLYFLTNTLTNIAGVYQIALDRIVFDSGFSAGKVKEIITRFEAAGKAFYYQDEFIIIPKWPKHQKWQEKKKIESGIITVLKNMPPQLLGFLKKIGYTYPIDSLSIAYDSLSSDETEKKYPTNYSDLDIDLDKDKDIDPDPEKSGFSFFSESDPKPEPEPQPEPIPHPPDLPPDKKAESKEDATAVFQKARSLWNEREIPPECRDLIIPPSEYDCLRTFQNYSWTEIKNAIENYDYHFKKYRCGPGWKPPPGYKSLYGFLKNGVSQYCKDEDMKKLFQEANHGG